MPELETLRVIWWVLMGVLIIGFAVTDGFDFGVAMLLPIVAKNEEERQLTLSAIRPIWEGNQVWIILGAGAIFAAWPYVYAVSFSGLYLLFLLLLLTMGISRPVSFKYRSKLPNLRWRRTWDHIVFIGGLLPAFIFGVIIGNVLSGVPFYLDPNLRMFYTGSFYQLFTPFACLCGVLSIAMLIMHGGLYLAIKTNDPLEARARYYAKRAALYVILFFALGGYWVLTHPGYAVLSAVDHNGFSNPLHKLTMSSQGAWISNYTKAPLLLFAPALGFLGALVVILTSRAERTIVPFIASGFSIAGIIATVGMSMFPFVLPSSVHSASSLLVWDASSTRLTLITMLIAVTIFLPIIIAYTSWVWYVLRGKVTNDMVEERKHDY